MLDSRSSILLTLAATVVYLFANVSTGRAAEAVLDAIVGDAHVSDSAIDILQQANRFDEVHRIEFLIEKLLPSPHHASFRTPIAFLPVDADLPGISRTDDESVFDGSLVSPAFQLMASAKKQRQLDKLHSRIREVETTGNEQRRRQLTMLAMVDLAADRQTAAAEELEELFALMKQVDPATIQRCPETLAIVAGLKHAQTRDIAREMLGYILQSHIRVFREEPKDAWDYFIPALAGMLNVVEDGLADDLSKRRRSVALRNWSRVAKVTARSRGLGYPRGMWYTTRGFVENLRSHEDDYLYFRSPLRGDFEVECDVTSFYWRDTHLSVAGTWVAPAFGGTFFRIGDFRQTRPDVAIAPTLTEAGDWIRYRTVIRDSTATTWFNGRRVHVEKLSPGHEPWLAIRSPWFSDGAVRDLRITGKPLIPETIDLATADTLPGWMPYFDETIPADWRFAAGQSNALSGIVGTRLSDNVGTWQESLLYYNRPMLEDGWIEYDFFYEPESKHVHPTLDRLAFLIEPTGVSIHRITDGRYDRTGADPANVSKERRSRRGPQSLPLKTGEWNRLRVTLAGDTVQLRLNHELIFERSLEPDNRRIFGLFHYADQTEARVRRIRWTGNWPKSLRPIELQELADLDSAPTRLKLADLQEFHHEFSKGLPTDRFSIADLAAGAAGNSTTAEGIRHVCSGGLEYAQSFIAPKLQIHGDFEVTATFEQLRLTPSPDGSCGIFMSAVFDNETNSHCSVYRGLVGKARHIMQCERLELPGGKPRMTWHGNQVEQCDSGRLRLLRVDNDLHCLLAEGDSDQFRLVTTQQVEADRLIPGGIRLMTAVAGDKGRTEVVWESISIRAERLSGPAVVVKTANLKELNESREQLDARSTLDFTTDTVNRGDVRQWMRDMPWDQGENGLRLTAPGSDDWTSNGITVRKTVFGDFDISADFDTEKLDRPRKGDFSSIYLQVAILGDERPQTGLLISRDADSNYRVIAEHRQTSATGSQSIDELAAIEIESVSGFRLTRRNGEIVYVVKSSDSTDRERIITQARYANRPVHISFFLHTGGADRASRVVLRSIDIRADRIR